MQRVTSFALAVLLTAGAARAGVYIQPLVLSGQEAPGTGGIFENISAGVINKQGDVVFRGSLGAGLNAVLYRVDTGGGLSLVAREGHPTGGLNVHQIFDYRIHDGGRVSFVGHFAGSSRALWSGQPAAMSVVAKVGDPAPNGNNYSSLGFPLAGGTSFLGYRGATTSGGPTTDAVWLYDGNSVIQQVSVGDPMPGTASNFGGFFAAHMNSHGHFFFGGSGGGRSGYFLAESGTVTPVAIRDEQAPGLDPGIVYAGFGNDSFSNTGQVAFQSEIWGGDVTASTSRTIFAGTPGDLRLVARSGMPAADLPGVNWTFFNEPTISNDGRVSFNALLSGAGVGSGNNEALFMGPVDDVRLFLRKGDAAPGTTANFVGWDWPHMNASGQAIMWAQLGGAGVTSSNNQAVYFIDSDGSFHLVIRKGDLFEVAPGDERIVATADFYRPYISHSGGDGRGIALNDSGEFVLRMTFTDGSSGLFIAAIPEPSAAAGLLGAGMLLLRRRRQRQLVAAGGS